MTGAAVIVVIVKAWLWIGAGVAVLFLFIGIDRVDEDARGAYMFRPLVVPGVLLLWPLVLWRWWVLETGRDEWAKRHDPPRVSHRLASVLMALAIAAVVALGLLARQTWPVDFVPERLEEAGQ